jgi:hypothetical protein
LEAGFYFQTAGWNFNRHSGKYSLLFFRFVETYSLKYLATIVILLYISCGNKVEKPQLTASKNIVAHDLLPALQSINNQPVEITFESYGCFHYFKRVLRINYVDKKHLIMIREFSGVNTMSKKEEYLADAGFMEELADFSGCCLKEIQASKKKPFDSFDIGTVDEIILTNGLSQSLFFNADNKLTVEYYKLVQSIRTKYPSNPSK